MGHGSIVELCALDNFFNANTIIDQQKGSIVGILGHDNQHSQLHGCSPVRQVR
jgi:hypothetical protein